MRENKVKIKGETAPKIVGKTAQKMRENKIKIKMETAPRIVGKIAPKNEGK